jgi:hypothetical protein
MKKLLIVGVAAICLAFAVPAMAKVTVGGMIGTEMYYFDQSGEVTQNGIAKGTVNNDNGRQELNIHSPQTHNRLIVRYENDEKNLTGYMEIRMGGTDDGNALDFKYGWLDYKLNDAVHFRIGKQVQTFSIMTPTAANMGFHDNMSLFVNYGNIQVTDEDALKLYWKFNDMIRMEFMISDPGRDDGEAPIGAGNPAAGGVNREENVLPKFEISFPMTFGNFSIEPAFTYLSQEYDQVPPGIEDNVDIWGASLGAKAAFGPVTITAEFNYGQNLGDDAWSGAGGAPPAWSNARARAISRLVDTNGDGTANGIADSDYIGGWIQFAFNFGPASIELAWGIENIENDGSGLAGVNDDIDVTRMGYAVSVPIKVLKNFTVQPGFIYHDRDDSAQDGVNNATGGIDYGSEWLLGVQFVLTF